MEQLKKKGWKLNLCFAAGLITGVLLGTALLCIIVSYRIDMYHKRIASLETTIQDKDARLEKLEKTINTKNLILKKIEIFLIFDGDEIDKLEIEKTIKAKYSSLLGKEVKNIDVDLVSQVVDKRIMKLKDRRYQLQVNRLILTETLKIWIEVEPIE